MMVKTPIGDTFTTAQAAQRLGLSQHQVAMLATSGEIASLRVGHMLMLDAQDVLRYEQNRCGKGRPLTQSTALAALWTLSGEDVTWLDYQQERRLAAKLVLVSPEELVWQCRKRCKIKRFRCNPSFLDKVKEQVSLSGRSSPFVSQMGLSSLEGGAEGYIHNDALEQVLSSCRLKEDQSGEVILRLVNTTAPSFDVTPMPIAVAAADLAESLVARERQAGLSYLKGALDDYRKN